MSRVHSFDKRAIVCACTFPSPVPRVTVTDTVSPEVLTDADSYLVQHGL